MAYSLFIIAACTKTTTFSSLSRPPIHTQELQDRLHEAGADWWRAVTRELEAAAAALPWRALCLRVLPLAGEAALLRALRMLGERHFGRGSLAAWAAAAEPGLAASATACDDDDSGGGGDAPLALAGVEWRDAGDALLAGALACRGARLLRVLRRDAAARGALARLEALAARLHGGGGDEEGDGDGLCSGAAARRQEALISGLDPASPRQRLLLLLDSWTLRLALLRACGDGGGGGRALERLLARLGWRWEALGAAGGGSGSGGGGEAKAGAGGALNQAGRAQQAALTSPPTKQQQEREPLSRGSEPRGRSRRRRRSSSSGRDDDGSRSRSRNRSRSRRRGSSSKKECKKKKKKRRRRRGSLSGSDSGSLLSRGSDGLEDDDGDGADVQGGRTYRFRAPCDVVDGGDNSNSGWAEGGADAVVEAVVRWACRGWVRAALR